MTEKRQSPLLFLLFFLLPVFLLPSRTCGETCVMVVTDTHFLAPSLFEGSDIFLAALARGDGKYVQGSAQLLEALIQEAERVHPDALVLTGDLTFNGEKESHLFLAEGLRRIEEKGIPVYVLPGNHDINVPNTVRYLKDGWSETENLDAAGFAGIYQDFLGDCSDSPGFSCTVKAAPGVSLLLLDCAFYEPSAQTFGLCDGDRLAWAAKAAEASDGDVLVSMTHHSLVPHSSFSVESFVIWNRELLIRELKGRSKLHLSGHLHIQHLAEEDGMTDIAQSAFSLWPHRYGLVRISDTEVVYESHTVDHDLLPEGFAEASKAWFSDTTWNKTAESLRAFAIAEEEKHTMLDYACRLNLAFFSGSLSKNQAESWKSEEGYTFWQAYRTTVPFAAYLDTLLQETGPDPLSLHK